LEAEGRFYVFGSRLSCLAGIVALLTDATNSVAADCQNNNLLPKFP
jgi:hypothetical protein